MTFTDYLLDTVLVLLVVRQIRESRFDRLALLLPIGIVAIVAKSYLHDLPTSGNDLALIAGFTAVGVVLGTVSGLATRVRADGGPHALVKAGWIAAGAWVLGMGFRFGFAVWASNGGGPDLARFSVAHHISVEGAWTAALVLMALGEVLCRTGVLWVRTRRSLTTSPAERSLVTV